MPLQFGQPETGLARELREVARDATALEHALAATNYELPSDFPVDQLVQIAQSLAQLPFGTAEGCNPALSYARNRLPAIRREHVVSEELDFGVADPDAAPAVVRGAFIDECLRHLIASVTTALDEYRRVSAEDAPDEVPEAGVAASGDVVESATTQSLKLETGLSHATEELTAAANPSSRSADILKRQLSDGQGLNRLARAELWMPKVVVSWYRRIVDAMKQYPTLIKNTAGTLKVGADIAEIGADRWHSFQKNQTTFLIDEIRSTCDSFIAVADKLDENKRKKTLSPAGPPDDYNLEVARTMILVGRVPPSHWIPLITNLEFGTRRLRSLEPVAALTNLKSLAHVAARVSNLEPLANLGKLQNLDLTGTRVSNLQPIGHLLNLTHLDIGWTHVRNLGPLSTLTGLEHLNSPSNLVKDVTPLSGLHRLKFLNLSNTSVDDVSPLASLTSLVALNLSRTAVIDLSPLSNLTALRQLWIANTKVIDVSCLQHLSSLTIIGGPQLDDAE